jgi:hypothetical protein
MRKQLNLEDRQAIDVLLERPDGQGSKTIVEMVFAQPARDQFEDRLGAAERVLELFGEMPAEDPPADLVSRTMQRIEQAQIEPATAIEPRFNPAEQDNGPHA